MIVSFIAAVKVTELNTDQININLSLSEALQMTNVLFWVFHVTMMPFIYSCRNNN